MTETSQQKQILKWKALLDEQLLSGKPFSLAQKKLEEIKKVFNVAFLFQWNTLYSNGKVI
ncbi:MAG: hypothetical protein IPN42_04885 [Methylococcaceae bacterium]|nr:hypothetical protein [Methylococcaceae bacterium]